jgi:hypothetical protein
MYFIWWWEYFFVTYTNSTNIPQVTIINKIYEHQNLLSVYLFFFLVGLRIYQHPCSTWFCKQKPGFDRGQSILGLWWKKNHPEKSVPQSSLYGMTLSVLLHHCSILTFIHLLPFTELLNKTILPLCHFHRLGLGTYKHIRISVSLWNFWNHRYVLAYIKIIHYT